MNSLQSMLLRLLQAQGGELAWEEAKNGMGQPSRQFSGLVRSVSDKGSLELRNGGNTEPRLKMTPQGEEELRASGPPVPVGRTKRLSGDLLVFVPLEEELRVLQRRWHLRQESIHDPAWYGEIVPGVQVRVLSGFGAGRVRAAVETLDYLHDYAEDRRPDLVVVIGICGGFAVAGQREPVIQGDVIVAERIADLGTRKMRSGPDGSVPEFQIEPFITDTRLATALRAGVFNKREWQMNASEDFDYPSGRYPTLRFGTLVCVDEVVSSDDWREGLLRSWPKALGVEMEAGGVMAACQKLGIPVSVLRGVSDLANPLKADDEWRSRSLKAAALALERGVAILVR